MTAPRGLLLPVVILAALCQVGTAAARLGCIEHDGVTELDSASVATLNGRGARLREVRVTGTFGVVTLVRPRLSRLAIQGSAPGPAYHPDDPYAAPAATAEYSVPWSLIQQLEFRGPNKLNGAVWGAGIGVIPGASLALAGATLASEPQSDATSSALAQFLGELGIAAGMRLMLYGTLIGAPVGTLVGAAIRTWKPEVVHHADQRAGGLPGGTVVAIVPFTNSSGRLEAGSLATSAFTAEARRRGWSVVPAESLSAALDTLKTIPPLERMVALRTPGTLARLRARTGAEVVLTGNVRHAKPGSLLLSVSKSECAVQAVTTDSARCVLSAVARGNGLWGLSGALSTAAVHGLAPLRDTRRGR